MILQIIIKGLNFKILIKKIDALSETITAF